jgi:hypothetical protein
MKKRLATLVVAFSMVVGTATAANAMSFRTLVNDLTGNSYYGSPYGYGYGGYGGYGGWGYNPYVGYTGYSPYYGYGYGSPYYGGYGYGGYGYGGSSLLNSLGGLLYNFF